MRSTFAAIALLVSLASTVSAQDTASVWSHELAAVELIEVMQLERAFTYDETMLNAIAPPMPGMERMRTIAMEFMREFLPWPVIKAEYVKIYRDLFSEAEIRELIAFYRTPIGEKLIALTPELSARTGQIVQKRLTENQPELMRRIMEEMQDGAPPPEN